MSGSADPTPEAWAAVASAAEPVRRYLFGLLRDPDDREDTLQETLLRGARYWRPGVRAVTPWLVQIAFGVAVDAMRRSTWQTNVEPRWIEDGLQVDVWDFRPEDPDRPAELLVREGVETWSDQARVELDALGEDADLDLLRRAYGGATRAELAEHLGVSEPLAKVRVFRAKGRVQRRAEKLRESRSV